MKIHRGNFESNVLFLKKAKVLKKGQKILEIGSGNGAMVSYLKKEGFNITGTEINKKYIAFAKKQFGVKLLPSKGESLPFKDKSFDVVLSFDVFEHIPDSNTHLQEVRRVLKDGGIYAFVTPNKLTNVPFEILKERSLTKYKEYHPSVKTYWGLKNLLQKQSFNLKFIEVPVVTPYFEEKIKKYLGSFGLFLIKIINPDLLPIFFKTNFYMISKNQKNYE